ncbi:MAG: 1-acyl-sn-glycerol-3-phosphate acyltransferase [Sandaracinaceae bacterium]
MRVLLEALCHLVLRIFFRRIEIVGEAQLPEAGVLLAPNHPNGLLDPLFVFTCADRKVSFLAKASLFDTFIVKHFVRTFEALPVYRAQDGHDTKKNAETLEAAAAVLAGGGAIAIFPEGKSHDAPEISRLKTGAARIALGGRANGPEHAPVFVVPTGIFYVDKRTFRSDAALVYGAPVEVPRVALDEAGEVPHEHARALTERIDAGLDAVVLQAESHALLHLSALASRLVQGARIDRGEEPLPVLDGPEDEGELARERRLRDRMIRRYGELETESPGRAEALVSRMRALEAQFEHHGLDPGGRARRAFPVGRAAGSLLLLLAAMPLALTGLVLSYPTYRLVGALAARFSKGEDAAVATLKMLGGLLFFPLTWLACGVSVGLSVGWLNGVVALLLAPLSSYVALRFFEALPRVSAWVRALRLRLTGADVLTTLEAERGALYDELLAAAE